MKKTLSNIPLLPITIAFICGIILGKHFAIIYVLVTFIGGLIAFVAKQRMYAIILLTASIGWMNTHINSAEIPPANFLNKETVFNASVISVKNNDNIQNIIAEVDIVVDSTNNKCCRSRCTLTVPSLNPDIEPGDEITFLGALTYISDKRDLPNEFDIVSYYKQQEIYLTAFIAPEAITITGHNDSWFLSLRQFRDELTHYITSLPLSEECIVFLNTTITGDTSMLDDETRLKYSTTGLAHILALSGLHVLILTSVIAIILLPFDIFKQRKLRYILTIILLWLYAVITGLSPSVTRAVIMATILLTAQIIQRNHSPFNSLCAAAILILVISPNSLYNIGFQLSFVAVASILLFVERLNPINPRKRILYKLMSLFTVSLSAMIGTGIIAAFYFHNFPIYFIIANIATSIILPIVIAGGVFALIAHYLGLDPTWICLIVDFFYHTIDEMTTYITTLPGASIDKIYFKGWLLIPYFAIIACCYAALKYKRVVWYILTLTMIIFTITIHIITIPQFPQKEYYIPRDTYYTNILVRDSSALYLISTAKGGDSIDVVEKCKRKYIDYMGWRNIDTIIRVPQYYETKSITRYGATLSIGNDIVIIIDNDNDVREYNIKPRYALICNGYKGNIIDVYNTLAPDTIILSRSLHKKRANRYEDSCKLNNIPYKNLIETGFHKVFN